MSNPRVGKRQFTPDSDVGLAFGVIILLEVLILPLPTLLLQYDSTAMRLKLYRASAMAQAMAGCVPNWARTR